MKKQINFLRNPKEINGLFVLLRASKTDLILRHDLTEYSAIVSKISKTSLSLFYKGYIPEGIPSIEITINYDTSYFMTCNVISIDKGEIALELPTEIKKGIKRKYNRIAIDKAVSANIMLLSGFHANVTNYTITTTKPNQHIANLYRQIASPKHSIHEVLVPAIKCLNSVGKIITFKLYTKEDSNNEDNLPEYPIIQLIKRTRKALYIPNLFNIESYLQKRNESYCTSLFPYVEELEKTIEDKNLIKEKLLGLIATIKKTVPKIKSYISIPIISVDEVMGYAILGGIDKEFNKDNLYTALITCDIISQALRKTNIDKFNAHSTAIDIELIDLSGGGAHIRFNNSILRNAVYKGLKLKIAFSIKETAPINVTAIGEIIRITKSEQNDEDNIIAIEFTEIMPTVQAKLDTYINRKIEIIKMSK